MTARQRGEAGALGCTIIPAHSAERRSHMSLVRWFTWRRTAAVVFCASGVLLLARVFAVGAASSEKGARAVGSTPYTVVLAETVTGLNGESSIASITTIAVRSDGSTAHRLGTTVKGSRLIHFASGLRVSTNDFTRRMSSTMRDPAVEPERDASGNCAKTSGRALVEDFAGVEVEKVTGVRAAKYIENASGIEATRWFAVDFGCAPLGGVVVFKDGQISRKEVQAFSPGEPDQALFAVPTDYQEGPPSTLAPPGLVKTEDLKRRDEFHDRRYYERRSR